MTTVVAVNIPHQLGPLAIRELAHEAVKLAGPEGVVFAVELDNEADRSIRGILRRTARRAWFGRRKTQVITPRKWTEVVPWQRTLTDAMKGVNPARDLNGVFHCDTRTVWCAAHMPNGKNKIGKSFREWRQQQWDRYETRAARKVAKWSARGWHFVIGGDLNDVRGATFSDRQRTIAHAGLMRLLAVPAPGYRVQTGLARTVRLPGADHPVLVVENVRFVKETA